MARDQVVEVSLDDTDVSPWNHWKGPKTAHDTVSLTIRIREVVACLGLRIRAIPSPLLPSTSVESQRNLKQQQVEFGRRKMQSGETRTANLNLFLSLHRYLARQAWDGKEGKKFGVQKERNKRNLFSNLLFLLISGAQFSNYKIETVSSFMGQIVCGILLQQT